MTPYTLECVFRAATATDEAAGMFGTRDGGFGLFVEPNGRPRFALGTLDRHIGQASVCNGSSHHLAIVGLPGRTLCFVGGDLLFEEPATVLPVNPAWCVCSQLGRWLDVPGVGEAPLAHLSMAARYTGPFDPHTIPHLPDSDTILFWRFGPFSH